MYIVLFRHLLLFNRTLLVFNVKIYPGRCQIRPKNKPSIVIVRQIKNRLIPRNNGRMPGVSFYSALQRVYKNMLRYNSHNKMFCRQRIFIGVTSING